MKKFLSVLLMVFCVSVLAGCGGGWALEMFGVSSIDQIVKSGDWIYYTNVIDGSLYRIKPDLTKKTKIGEVGFSAIQEDTIYFIEENSPNFECSVSKIETDGTGYTMIADLGGENMFIIDVTNGWIYYGDRLNNGSEINIYKIKIDGAGKTKIADINNSNGNMIILDDWIYYMDGSSLSKMRTDGTEATILLNGVELFEINNGWIYCGEVTEDGVRENIYKMSFDGAGKSKLADGAFVAIDGERIYYLLDDWLCSANLDGSDVEKLNNALGDVTVEVIYADYIYYIETTYSGSIGPAYRINLDGSNKIRIK